MKKIVVLLLLFIQFGAYAQLVGTPYMQPSSSNGTAIISAYDCSTASTGTLTGGIPVSGVTQTITATVLTVGTYNISITSNGVTFAANGTFTSTGAKNIVLTATGEPTDIGLNDFILNTVPNCKFSRDFLPHPTSGGTAIVSAYDCSTGFAGTLKVGTPVSGVTQTITATVTKVGKYNIYTTTPNGVTFRGSDTFTALGNQTIVLTATGTPTAKGSNTFTLSNTIPNCNFSRYTSITGVYAKVNGVFKDFWPRNLGATSDEFNTLVGNDDGSGGTLGYLYQWGRQTDGHELRNSSLQQGPLAASVANKFIFNATNPRDWISPSNDNLWQDGSKTTTDPCPPGYRVPTQLQWAGIFKGSPTQGAPSTATQNTWTWTNSGYLVGTNLFLPAASYRQGSGGAYPFDVGTNGYYWSSTFNGTAAYGIRILNSWVYADYYSNRANGFSIRCIEE